jgi:beta-glucosidase
MKLFVTAMAMGVLTMLAGCQSAPDIEDQVDALYDKMSQEERVAQLRSMYMDELFDDKGQLDPAKCRELIPNGIGHFSQFCMQKPRDPNEIRDRVAAVQKWLMENTPNGIPALCHEEVLSGVNTKGSTIYPQQIGQACSFNPELAELKTRQTATAMRKMGGVLSLSPMVDVCRNPSFNRLEESYGEDGYLSAVMGVAFVNGLQQSDLKKGVGACSKHYLGYGGGGDAPEKELMEDIILPHEAMVRVAGSKAVMPGYHVMAGKKQQCVADSTILQGILRGYLEFDGMVVSDYTAIDQLVLNEELRMKNEESGAKSEESGAKSEESNIDPAVMKAAAAINGGCDVDFPHGANYKYLPEALEKGLVKPEAFERAVKSVLRYKFRAGMFDKDAYLYSKEDIQLDTPEERQTAYDIATQSIVLLENNGVLPLANVQKVFLTGPNANSMWSMCGDYSFPAMSFFWKMVKEDLDHPHTITLLEGMTDCLKDSPISLSYSQGCDWTEEIETKFSELGDERAWEYGILHRKVEPTDKIDKGEALRLANEADVIVAAVGENVMLCGENRDRQGLRLPGKQEEYVNELIATGKPVVLVVFGGRAQVISGLAEKCAAVIQAWYPGEEGGHAVADILFGKVTPSGKLSVSYPKEELNEPVCYNYPQTSSSSKIAWPFGYGLSYTTFEYSDLQMDSLAKTTDESLTLSFKIKNTGKAAGDEIAQVYISPQDAKSPVRPIQLQGFARVALQPGETKTVTVKLFIEQFGYYYRESVPQWRREAGDYLVKIGASSQDIRLQQQVTLDDVLVSNTRREHYFSEVKID